MIGSSMLIFQTGAEMNPFERFSIERLSYSSLDLWSSNPLLWCLRYLAKMPSDVGPGAWRGTAVGVGLADFFRRGDIMLAVDTAMTRFNQEANGSDGVKVEKERGLIANFLETAIAHFGDDRPQLTAAEERIEYKFDGVMVPLVGYVDLRFSGRPFIELKTTLRLPSQPQDNHIGQVAIYSDALKEDGELLYVTDKRAANFPIGGNVKVQALSKLRRNALSLQRFLSSCETIDEAINSLPIRSDDFKWSEAANTALESYPC